MEIRIPYSNVNVNGNGNDKQTSSTNVGQRRQRHQSTPLKPYSSGTFGATAATATQANASAKISNKMFKSFSTRFNSSAETIPTVETVAQEYARTIKALWQMVEEEELAYQIDAAATARLAQQQQFQLRAQQLQGQAEKDRAVRHKYTVFPMPQERPRSGLCTEAIDRDELESLTCPVKSGHDADSEDSDSDDEEDHEQKKRDLEDLERELTILGLQRFQESCDSLDLKTSRRSSHHEQPRLQMQLQQQKQQQQQQEQQKQQPQRVLPPLIQTSVQRPYQRRRQNSLTYEERRLHNDTRRQLSKPTSPITPMASSPISPMKGATVNFFDGIVLDEESSDDNDDGVVLSVARRVSVRLPHRQSETALKQDPSWDRARGVSWSPVPNKLSPPTASLPEARLAITTMISAR
ncbi:hypothetical protein BGZ80_005098 [Entomortierella chlamydospora]|uniref:Uncharacterized protein n=1 Tax=Entomortierella chlamydospora TaxID=101097 RepID=A0A9P6SVH8_9FUNG|nr:hypothetical protein BGZ80_005098 [Entomortierella chlamydospora]